MGLMQQGGDGVSDLADDAFGPGTAIDAAAPEAMNRSVRGTEPDLQLGPADFDSDKHGVHGFCACCSDLAATASSGATLRAASNSLIASAFWLFLSNLAPVSMCR